MTKEEILEKSRNENKNQDIYDLEVQNKSSRVAIYVTAILCILLTALKWILTKRLPLEFLMILCGMETALFTAKFINMHKKHELFVAILYGCGFLIFTVAFIKKIFF